MILATAIIFWAAVDIIFDPGIIEIKFNNSPAVIYNTNDKSWAVPVYDQTKHIVKCIETDSSRCLRSN